MNDRDRDLCLRFGNTPPFEVRDDDGDGNFKVSGHAAVFNQITEIGGWYREVIEPGAFTDAIKRDDVVFLINHDGLPLARTRSKTLKLSEDSIGLHMETVLDGDDSDVKSIVGKMQRGDLDTMSFAFIPQIQEWDDEQDPPLRTIKKVELVDVSIVTRAAYEGTDIGLRSLQLHQADLRDTKTRNFHAVGRRLRMKMNLGLRDRENG